MERGTSRRYPIGAELIGPNQTHFRVWAPKAQEVDVVLEESAKKDAKRTFHPLHREDGRYFSGVAISTTRPARLLVRGRSNPVRMDGFKMARRANERPDYLRNARRYFYERGNVARGVGTTGRAGTDRHHCR